MFSFRPFEKMIWAFEQLQIKDSIIYTQWDDIFSWRLHVEKDKDDKVQSTLFIYNTHSPYLGSELISDHPSTPDLKITLDIQPFLNEAPKDTLEKVNISPNELKSQYLFPNSDAFSNIDWASDEEISLYLWNNKYYLFINSMFQEERLERAII